MNTKYRVRFLACVFLVGGALSLLNRIGSHPQSGSWIPAPDYSNLVQEVVWLACFLVGGFFLFFTRKEFAPNSLIKSVVLSVSLGVFTAILIPAVYFYTLSVNSDRQSFQEAQKKQAENLSIYQERMDRYVVTDFKDSPLRDTAGKVSALDVSFNISTNDPGPISIFLEMGGKEGFIFHSTPDKKILVKTSPQKISFHVSVASSTKISYKKHPFTGDTFFPIISIGSNDGGVVIRGGDEDKYELSRIQSGFYGAVYYDPALRTRYYKPEDF